MNVVRLMFFKVKQSLWCVLLVSTMPSLELAIAVVEKSNEGQGNQ